jgi:uncharacterized protein (TIGR02996 family)
VSEGDSLLAGVRANSQDDELRFVYADWLEDNDEPDRAAYLRLQVKLSREWWYARPCPELYAAIAEQAARIDPAWLAMVRRCTTPAPPVDIEAAIPSLRGRAKTAVRLHPRPGEAPIDASKIGGLFLWPKMEPWPVCPLHGTIPYVTALQLRKEDVPELGFPPDTDLFQLLWCPVRHDEDDLFCPKPAVFWRNRSTVSQPQMTAPDRPTVEYGYFPAACVLYPERVQEYPDPFEFESSESLYESGRCWPELELALATLHRLEPPRGLHHPDDPSGLYQTCLSTSEGTKVAGYPDWVHDSAYPRCDCNAEMEHLLSFGSWEWGGNNWGRWVPIEDRPILNLQFPEQGLVHRAHGCMFGDAGRMYVFVCRKHREPRIRASIQ